MSMKKTDLEKNMAKKLDGRLKSQATPQRFGQASTKSAKSAKSASPSAAPAAPAAPKLVQVVCRLPAPLATQLRERAITHEGGISALLTTAVEQYLAANKKP